ncbi:hypothetical protein [Congregibacter sp.]|jgi:hypothetical protein|uniref:hypothetical protein n=1 Tax=Congregibacter sp. TaxID=2744308 RepID=UPI0039E4A994
MRFSLLISALTLAALAGFMTGCATPATPATPAVPAIPEEPLVTSCEEPRPKVCTMIFAPVCATRAAGIPETYASGCNACADDQVAAYINGACDDEGSTL